ncbi:GBS Bsp-like repeat-containing protein [Streptococcus dentasini]
MRKDLSWSEKQRFSIRKYSLGAASVLIGASLLIGNQVLADEQAAPNDSIPDTTVQTVAVNDEGQNVVTDTGIDNLQENKTAEGAASVASEISDAASQADIKEGLVTNEAASATVDEATQTDGNTTPPVAANQNTESASSSTDTSEVTLPTLERYTFDKEVEVKSEPKVTAKTDFTFKQGESISYDKRLQTDGYNWISYVSYNGNRRYVMLDKLAAPEPQPSEPKLTGQISFENQTEQGFDIRISNVSDDNGVLAVKVPIWTVKNDQDDLIWYDGVKQDDGTYKVAVKLADHKNDKGDYLVHLYYVENDGRMVGITEAKYTVEETTPQVTTRTGTLSFSNQANGDFDVIISDVSDSAGLKAVKVPVWTDDNGQDDLVWYDGVQQGDGTYKVSVKRSDHKDETGLYQIHLYYIENDGQMVGITNGQHTPEVKKEENKLTGTITIQNQTADGFEVVVTNVADSKGIKAVKVPVWTEQSDQDDVVWYDATKQDNGDYMAVVKTSEHKGEHGDYNIHLYYVEDDDRMVGVAATKTTVPQPEEEADYESTLPSLRSYTFVKQVDVRNSPQVASDVVFTFDAGESINYDKILRKDGHNWISYVSYGGQRRYIVID